ncbi:PH domain-containing protein [Halorubrum ezzemoulense]|uniref:PH domain-containing protein n=1 Tax=Halorubrum ezzemoulense TaxID=337243 RepID=UPI0023312D6D|nr:PH domain-containing protein [Halorubrum ezzemoulense]MDB2223289.1 PH domain-containing protein [Halorubrum ezzemoulense]MDB2270378.1 PH domain-containing protein [Halorubrum ezzemoulense]
MLSPSLQEEPKTGNGVTADLDLDWLSLDDDEEIRWASTPHRYSVVPALLVGVPLSLVLVGIPIVAASYLQYKNTNYVVTNKGLYSKRGILSRDVKQIGFEKVQNISYSQSAIGSSLGYGSVEVSTAGGSGVELRFRSIPDPASVQELIAREIDAGKRDSADGDADDVLAEILVELRAIRSAVTDDGAGGDAETPTATGEDVGAERTASETAREDR